MKMNNMKVVWIAMFALISAFTLSACTPEAGSEGWCNSMKEKPKGEWTAEHAGIYAKHCVMGHYKK